MCCAAGVWPCAVLGLWFSMPPALPLLPHTLTRHPPVQVICLVACCLPCYVFYFACASVKKI